MLTPPIPDDQASAELQALFDEARQRLGKVTTEVRMMGHIEPFARDMMHNHLEVVRNGLGFLSDKQREAVALGVSSANHCVACVKAHRRKCLDLGYSEAQALEIIAVAVECAMLNTLYTFRRLAPGDFGKRPSPLRSRSLVDVSLDELTVQLICLSVSAVNACQSCVEAHVKKARDAGASDDQIDEASLVAAVMTGYNHFFRLQHD